jgi:hypothetical protein
MTTPLVLTVEEVEIISNALGVFKAVSGNQSDFDMACEALELLTSPRYEALGLSKEEWESLGFMGDEANLEGVKS